MEVKFLLDGMEISIVSDSGIERSEFGGRGADYNTWKVVSVWGDGLGIRE